jgi:hypothetical protein
MSGPPHHPPPYFSPARSRRWGKAYHAARFARGSHLEPGSRQGSMSPKAQTATKSTHLHAISKACARPQARWTQQWTQKLAKQAAASLNKHPGEVSTAQAGREVLVGKYRIEANSSHSRNSHTHTL